MLERDLRALLAALRVDDAHEVRVLKMMKMPGEVEASIRAASSHVNIGVSREEARLLVFHGARRR
jgi:hypothetical protein